MDLESFGTELMNLGIILLVVGIFIKLYTRKDQRRE